RSHQLGNWASPVLLGRCDLAWPNVPRDHPPQQPVPDDQRVKQNGPKVSEKGQEKQIGENRVRPPQDGVEHEAVRKDKGQLQGAEKGRSDSAPPTAFPSRPTAGRTSNRT